MTKLRWIKMSITGIVLAASLTGCPSTIVDTSCTAFGPIQYSAMYDTEQTVTAVRQHNAAWRKLCK